MSTQDISCRRAWATVPRPQTLPVAAASVVVGTAVAVHADLFVPLPTFAALVGALLIQVGTNFANDYYDAVQGADTETREGFTHVTAGGLISSSEVKRAMYLIFAVAVPLSTYLVYAGGVPILVVGLLPVVSGTAYTGGPYPLGYHGLGGLLAFVFLGLVAVAGTFYAQAASVLAAPLSVGISAGTVTLVAVLASLPIVAISTNTLVVNNVRDKEEDAATGKWTLAVRFGYGFARTEYVIMLALAYVVSVYLWTCAGFDQSALPLAFSMPVTARTARTVVTETKGEELNPTFEDVRKLLALYAVLFSIGLVLT